MTTKDKLKEINKLLLNNENSLIENNESIREYINKRRTDISGKWVCAKDLKVGDRVLLSDGKYGIIEKIEIEKLETPETTYNFEVEDFHTYYVGKQSVLVHNDGCYSGKTTDGEDYIGRTNDFDRRASEHYGRGRLKEGSLTPLTDQSLTKEQARLLEQMLIENAGGVANLGNRINSIAKSNPLYKQIEILKDVLKSLLK